MNSTNGEVDETTLYDIIGGNASEVMNGYNGDTMIGAPLSGGARKKRGSKKKSGKKIAKRNRKPPTKKKVKKNKRKSMKNKSRSKR